MICIGSGWGFLSYQTVTFFSHGRPPVKQHRVLRPHPASKIYAHTVKILYMGAAALYTVYTATQNKEEEKKEKKECGTSG